MRPERRTFDELVILYRLESTIRDVYVEGDVDRSLIEWFLTELGFREVGVTTIEYVDVPAAEVLRHGFSVNNRGRLLALGVFLEGVFGAEFRQVTCVVDSDFDIVNRKVHNCSVAVFTDYTSMEMYCLNPKTLGKFLKIGIGNFPKTGAIVISQISEALQDLFTVRMANEKLGWGMQAISIEKDLSIDGTGLHLDLQGYLRRYLNKNNKNGQSTALHEAIEKCKGQLTADARFQIHGHDFIDALTWFLKHHNGFGHLRKNVVERALFASLETALLKEGLMFRTLVERLRTDFRTATG